VTGTKLTYDKGDSATVITGLTDLTDYFVVSINRDYFRLATSASNAASGTTLTVSDFGTGVAHKFTTSQLNGNITGGGSVTIVSGSVLVNGVGTQFSKILKVGDRFRLFPANTVVNINFIPADINTSTNIITKAAHGFSTGDTVQFNVNGGVSPAPLVDQYYYFVRAVSSSTITLHSSASDAVANINVVAISTQGTVGGIGYFSLTETIPVGPIIRRITAIGSDTQISVDRPYASAYNAVSYSYPTFIYVRPEGYSLHRPFDGGVEMSVGARTSLGQIVRQTRKYFRYQSGKGIQFSTGSMLKPVFAVDLITSSSTTVTVKTRYEHFLGVGAQISVSGCDQTAYNGIFTVTAITGPRTFTYTATEVPSATTATGFPIDVAPYAWYGGQNRIGMFDNQNGFFYEFDGQTFSAVRRSSVDQISGIIATTQGSPEITGTDTRFADQLEPGDTIVIRGQDYIVSSITSQTQLYVFPEYRGASITSGGIISKIVDFKVPQSQWNIDKMDGTGPSGVNLNLSKMQMFYIDYSWYGAGAIRFGFKDHNGEVIYCHRMTHANVKTEAYMRTGNLPARYESASDAPKTLLSATLSNSATTITVESTTGFPSAGILVITAPGNTAQPIEYVSYTGKTATTFTGVTRAKTDVIVNPVTGGSGGGAASGQTFTYSATAPIPVVLYTREVATGTSHWGSSVIMDGGYDDDKSFIFQTGMRTSLAVPTGDITKDFAMLSLRLAPSVDNGVVGSLGQRELINRMQLTLRELGVLAETVSGSTRPGKYLVKLILNGQVNANATWTNIGGSSLCQQALHSTNNFILPNTGETIYSFFVSTVTNEAEIITRELDMVRDLGNSILGGGVNNTYTASSRANIYPDGPDHVTVTVANLGASVGAFNARIGWTEAQA
jgi:hypothetical protein